jgi:calcineurin-like phosphoesterase family protein
MSGAPEPATATVHFTADTHFGHGGALGLFRRPFASVAEMDEALVERWNTMVAPEDCVWHLGDFGVRLRLARATELLARLNGFKHLVAGNNDGAMVQALTNWSSVQDYAEIELDGQRLVLCHYPLRAWNGQHRGAINLHGHSHGRLAPWPRQVDVGVDAWDFRPIRLEQIGPRLRARRGRRPSPP